MADPSVQRVRVFVEQTSTLQNVERLTYGPFGYAQVLAEAGRGIAVAVGFAQVDQRLELHQLKPLLGRQLTKIRPEN